MKVHAQKQGEIGEKNLLLVLQELLTQFSKLTSLRRYESGYQEGKDIKAEGLFNKKRNVVAEIGSEKFKWFFEVKNYKSKLDPYKITGKISQVRHSQYKIDVFCLFSPHEDLHGLLEDIFTQEKLLNVPEYPFLIVLWTPSMQIKEKLKAFPQIYEKVYGEKITISKDEQKKCLEEWEKEIKEQTKKGREIQEKFMQLYQGDIQVWIPDSIESAKKSIKSAGSLEDDFKKSGILKKKLAYGGITASNEVFNAKHNRIYSEAIRRRYKKKDERFYNKLNELRQELYNFCLNIEKDVLENKNIDEAKHFLDKFTAVISQFKKDYRDSDLIKYLPDFYYKGQMFDITGECLLSLSNKWLKEVEKQYDIN